MAKNGGSAVVSMVFVFIAALLFQVGKVILGLIGVVLVVFGIYWIITGDKD